MMKHTRNQVSIKGERQLLTNHESIENIDVLLWAIIKNLGASCHLVTDFPEKVLSNFNIFITFNAKGTQTINNTKDASALTGFCDNNLYRIGGCTKKSHDFRHVAQGF